MKVLLDHRHRKDYPDCPTEFPTELLNQEWALRTHAQTLTRLDERGGMDPSEIIANVERRQWRYMPMRRAIKQLKELLK